uniref:SPRY-associated domain-containing protein n=1 Tax=Neogobius melanostomus TaxID=47308 RepID=A0A8C6SF26_9GOBI
MYLLIFQSISNQYKCRSPLKSEQGLTAAVFSLPQRKLKLSDNNKKATCVREDQPYPDHQDRFEFWFQLLCDTGLTGRCYWEVQGIKRKGGDDSLFGCNDQSWSLSCSKHGFSVWHKNKQTRLPQPCSSSGTPFKLVDCAAGSLSFYTVSSEELIHLHTFNTTFTQTLISGFGLWTEDSSVSLSD